MDLSVIILAIVNILSASILVLGTHYYAERRAQNDAKIKLLRENRLALNKLQALIIKEEDNLERVVNDRMEINKFRDIYLNDVDKIFECISIIICNASTYNIQYKDKVEKINNDLTTYQLILENTLSAKYNNQEDALALFRQSNPKLLLQQIQSITIETDLMIDGLLNFDSYHNMRTKLKQKLDMINDTRFKK